MAEVTPDGMEFHEYAPMAQSGVNCGTENTVADAFIRIDAACGATSTLAQPPTSMLAPTCIADSLPDEGYRMVASTESSRPPAGLASWCRENG